MKKFKPNKKQQRPTNPNRQFNQFFKQVNRPKRRNNNRNNNMVNPISYNNKNKINKLNVRSGKKSTLVNHRELISYHECSSNGSFKCESYPMNPGLSTSYPWLCKNAVNYDRYKFRSCSWVLVPMQPTTEPGTMAVAFSPDALSVTPTTLSQLTQFEGATTGSIFKELTIGARVDNYARYVRTGSILNTDVKTYDAGVLFVATEGCSATTKRIFNLYVDYTVELFNASETQGIAFSADQYNNDPGYIYDLFATAKQAAKYLGNNVMEGIKDIGYTYVKKFSDLGTYLVNHYVRSAPITDNIKKATTDDFDFSSIPILQLLEYPDDSVEENLETDSRGNSVNYVANNHTSDTVPTHTNTDIGLSAVTVVKLPCYAYVYQPVNDLTIVNSGDIWAVQIPSKSMNFWANLKLTDPVLIKYRQQALDNYNKKFCKPDLFNRFNAIIKEVKEKGKDKESDIELIRKDLLTKLLK